MPINTDKDIEKIARCLIACTLPKQDWTHAAHFASALWLLRHPTYDPFTEMPDMIRRYNLSVGVENSDTDGYHETITQASLRAARHILIKAKPDAPLIDILSDLIASPFGKPDWILSYWSKEVLFSVSARREWVEPDTKSLPF